MTVRPRGCPKFGLLVVNLFSSFFFFFNFFVVVLLLSIFKFLSLAEKQLLKVYFR